MKEKMGNKIIGVGLILGAIFCVVTELGYLQDFNFMTMILGILFAGGTLGGILNKKFNQAIYCAGFFYYFTQSSLGMPKLGLWVIIVACTLFALGVSFIYTPKKISMQSEGYSGNVEWTTGNDNSHITVKTLFGDTEKFLNTKKLQYVYAKSLFGGIKLYFDEAEMKDEVATIDVSVGFGEIMLFVPKNWNVECNPTTIFGECNIRGRHEAGDKTLIINGNVLFGDLQIMYI